MKRYCLPDHAPDWAFALVYARDIARQPRMAWGLRDEQGRAYYVPPRGVTNPAKSRRRAA